MTKPLLRILYATVSGTARQVAEAIALDCSDLPGGSADAVPIANMLETGPEVFDPAGPPLLLCVATTGSGDVPDDARMLFSGLQDAPRYLGGLRYALVALGDSSYGSTFCGGGSMFDAALLDLGAQRIGDALRLDATEETEPEKAAVDWFRKTGLIDSTAS